MALALTIAGGLAVGAVVWTLAGKKESAGPSPPPAPTATTITAGAGSLGKP